VAPVLATSCLVRQLYFAPEMKFVRTFKSDTDVNAGAISPIKRHIVLGGGPPAVDIAKQDAGPGKLDSKFYNAVTGEEFGRISGHFGPIQTMAIHPDGRRCVFVCPRTFRFLSRAP
jgi:translation initiation factor 3 subunit I